MTEREDVTSRREACHKALQALHAAMGTLNSLPHTLLSSEAHGTTGKAR